MLDSSTSTNVMTLKVMNELGLKISRPYKNVQAVDFQEVQVCKVIKDLEVCLQKYPRTVLTMDVIVIDCSPSGACSLPQNGQHMQAVAYKWIGHMQTFQLPRVVKSS